ncbi:hypothetical protein GCM10020221_14470 [Streptomyces thioluteus]|uniref:Uncharacterized protein n=1 Tax=Streptomyces thioluteus TaxID=66431 RepID=A0ABN3WLH5_STRTU
MGFAPVEGDTRCSSGTSGAAAGSRCCGTRPPVRETALVIDSPATWRRLVSGRLGTARRAQLQARSELWRYDPGDGRADPPRHPGGHASPAPCQRPDGTVEFL